MATGARVRAGKIDGKIRRGSAVSGPFNPSVIRQARINQSISPCDGAAEACVCAESRGVRGSR